MNTQPRHRSALAQHPDIKEVLPRFVARLPGHVQRLRELLAADDAPELTRLVHQLRGTGKSYGFERLSELAATAEEKILAGAAPQQAAADIQQLITYILNIEGYPA